MRKFIFTLSMLLLGVGASQAQVAYEKAKLLDNVYLGVEGGATVPMNLNPTAPVNSYAGLKLGKNFTPIFGANLEGVAGFGDNGMCNSHTVVRLLNLGFNGTINLTNLFMNYNPEKKFEVIAEAGIGYAIIYGDKGLIQTENLGDDTELTSKMGVQFAWNLGKNKAWQLYVEPVALWNMTPGPGDAVRFNKNAAQMGIFAGLNYKFKTSNGTHNFKVWNVGQMNDEINSLREQLAAKPKVVTKEVIKEVVKEVPSTKEISVDNLVFVTFAQGKSLLTSDAKKALNSIMSGRHVQVVGTASPEGSKEFNDRLSQARADVVANYLKGRGIVVDEATGKGVQGTTSNRLAVVYVK